jgi:hypothetical protein
MKTFNRIALILIALLPLIASATAGERNVDPVRRPPSITATIRNAVQFMPVGNMNAEQFLNRLQALRRNKQSHVCVCEIMKLENNNDQYEEVALLSEKIDNGDLSAEYKVAGKQLVTERQRLKELFFDVVKVTEKVNAPVDCVTLYLLMAGRYDDLKMYDILDSDILNAKR